MHQLRFLTSSDEHLSDRPPGFRKDDYRSSILKKIEWQGEFAKKIRANAVLRGGDFFHVKAANKTTHATMQLAMKAHSFYPCPVYSIAGNHDMSENDPASVLRQQPLGVLFKSKVFNILRDNTFSDGSLSVRVVGLEYTTDIDTEEIQRIVRKDGKSDYTVAVIHALATYAPEERIQTFFNERIFDYRDLVFDGCPDIYVFGHYHKDQGIYDHMGVKFVNLGSISRGSLTFENLDRKPKVSVITADNSGIDVEEVVVPHEDSSDIFDIDLKKRIDKERKSLDDFINKLKSPDFDPSSSTMDEMKAELNKFPEDVRKMAIEIIETVENGDLDE